MEVVAPETNKQGRQLVVTTQLWLKGIQLLLLGKLKVNQHFVSSLNKGVNHIMPFIFLFSFIH